MSLLFNIKNVSLSKRFILICILINTLVNYRFFMGEYFYSWDTPLVSKNVIGTAYPTTLIDDLNPVSSKRLNETPRILINNLTNFVSSNFGLNFNSYTITFLFILPGIIFGSSFTYLLAKRYSKSEFYSVIASVFYVNSSYTTASLLMGHLGIYTSIMFLPFAIYYYEKLGIDDKTFKKFSLVLFISSIYDFRFIFLILIYVAINELFSLNKLNVYRKFINYFKIFLITFFLNLFWIVPEIYLIIIENYYKHQSNVLLTRTAFYGIQNDITFSLLNQHPNMDFSSFTLFTKKEYQPLLFLLPLLLLFSIYSKINSLSNDKNFFIKVISFLIFIFLSKVNSYPFFDSYIYLNNIISIFTSLIRDGTRFYPMVTILYIIIISIIIKSYSGSNKLSSLVLKFSYVIVFCYFVFQFLKYDNNGMYQIREKVYQRMDSEISNFFTEEVKGNILTIGGIDYLYTFGGKNNRVVPYEQYKDKYKQDPISECKNNPNYFEELIYKFNIKFLVVSKSNTNLKEISNCLGKFKEIYLGHEFNSRNFIYENTSNSGTFYSDKNILEYYKFQNFFYKISLYDESIINSNIFFHPSWIAFEITNNGKVNENTIIKSDYNFLKIDSISKDPSYVYLIFFPQILFYIGMFINIITLVFILREFRFKKK